MISDEYVNKVKDTFHNAISIGVVQQDLYLLAAAYIFLRNTSYFSLINLQFSSKKWTFLASESLKIGEQ